LPRTLRTVSTNATGPSVPAGARPAVSRAQAAADAIASLRAEGLEPERAEPLLEAWSRGQLTDAQLEEASHRLLHDRDLAVEQLLANARAA
jgi:hypothetical protein